MDGGVTLAPDGGPPDGGGGSGFTRLAGVGSPTVRWAPARRTANSSAGSSTPSVGSTGPRRAARRGGSPSSTTPRPTPGPAGGHAGRRDPCRRHHRRDGRLSTRADSRRTPRAPTRSSAPSTSGATASRQTPTRRSRPSRQPWRRRAPVPGWQAPLLRRGELRAGPRHARALGAGPRWRRHHLGRGGADAPRPRPEPPRVRRVPGEDLRGGRTARARRRPVETPLLDVYDPATDTWTPLADMPLAKGHIAADLRVPRPDPRHRRGDLERIYTSEVAAYDPATNTWEELTPFPENIPPGSPPDARWLRLHHGRLLAEDLARRPGGLTGLSRTRRRTGAVREASGRAAESNHPSDARHPSSDVARTGPACRITGSGHPRLRSKHSRREPQRAA